MRRCQKITGHPTLASASSPVKTNNGRNATRQTAATTGSMTRLVWKYPAFDKATGESGVGLNGSYGAENAGRFDQQLKLQAPRTAQPLKTIPVPESALPITLAHNDARNIKSMLSKIVEERRRFLTIPHDSMAKNRTPVQISIVIENCRDAPLAAAMRLEKSNVKRSKSSRADDKDVPLLVMPYEIRLA